MNSLSIHMEHFKPQNVYCLENINIQLLNFKDSTKILASPQKIKKKTTNSTAFLKVKQKG